MAAAAFRLTARRGASASFSVAATAGVAQTELIIDGAPVALDSFITSGPLFDRCVGGAGSPEAAAPIDLSRWASRGAILAEAILERPSSEPMCLAEAVRVYQYYLPIFFWVKSLMEARAAKAPLFVGLSCPQGGGKTTLVEALEALFRADGKVCANMSLDDFYLTHADQLALKGRNEGNGLLELRGNPGSHDVELVASTLADLAAGGAAVPIPRYDKTQFSGKGDRRPREQWTVLSGAPDVVLFEGWCFGFKARPDGDFAEPGAGAKAALSAGKEDSRLLPVNAELAGPYAAIHGAMDSWIIVEVESVKRVYAWREEAEAKSRAAGKPAMTEAEVKDFVDRYMPAYHAYLPALYSEGPDGAEGKPVLSFQIDATRNPVAEADAKPFAP